MFKKTLIAGAAISLVGLIALGFYVFATGMAAEQSEIELDGLEDRSRVDIEALIDSAAEHATGKWEDAALWEFTMFGVSANGRLDMTSRLSAVSFSYASPLEHLPYKMEGTEDPPCMYINVTPHGAVKQVRGGVDAECQVGVVSPVYDARPSCEFDEIWSMLHQRKDVPDDLAATVTYRPNEDGGTWIILGDGGFRADIPDVCEVPGEPAKQPTEKPAKQPSKQAEEPKVDPSNMLTAICDPGSIDKAQCATCPGFTGAEPSAGPLKLVAKKTVNITGFQDQLLTFEGCSPNTAKDVSTVLVSRREGTWERLAHLRGAHLEDCTLLDRGRGYNLAVCITRSATREGTIETVVALQPSKRASAETRPLISVENRTAACDTDTYMLDEIKYLHAQDVDDDGDEDLQVMIRRRQGELPPTFETSCDEGFNPSPGNERVTFLNIAGSLERKP